MIVARMEKGLVVVSDDVGGRIGFGLREAESLDLLESLAALHGYRVIRMATANETRLRDAVAKKRVLRDGEGGCDPLPTPVNTKRKA